MSVTPSPGWSFLLPALFYLALDIFDYRFALNPRAKYKAAAPDAPPPPPMHTRRDRTHTVTKHTFT